MVEGEKLVRDLFRFEPKSIEYVVFSDDFTKSDQLEGLPAFSLEPKEFNNISNQTQPQGILAICNIPDHYFHSSWDGNGFALFFDGIQDPGNLGTMFRTAEWFGIDRILIGPETVDPYSPKVVQAAMGSHAYLTISQCSYDQVIASGPVLVADMDGDNAYEFDWPDRGVLVMSNEGRGISDFFNHGDNTHIALPAGSGSRSESLNVSMACTALLTLRSMRTNSIPGR